MNGKKRITGRPIACGTDFSATASEAVDIAAAMSRRLETKLLLLHVDELYASLVSDPITPELSRVRPINWLAKVNLPKSGSISRSRSWQADSDAAEASAGHLG